MTSKILGPERTFTIGTSTSWSGPRRWWTVKIYPNLTSLRAASARFDPTTDFSRCYACCQTQMFIVDADTGERRFGHRGYTGVLRFSRTELRSDLITHELLHAAMSIYRINFSRDIRLGKRIASLQEERICYIFCELYAAFETHFNHPLKRDGT